MSKANPRIYSTDNAKAIKADKYGWLNAIHYLAPGDTGSVGFKKKFDLCIRRTAGCSALCLGEHSGQAAIHKPGEISPVFQSRIGKAQWFMSDRISYMAAMVAATEAVLRKAKRLRKKLCVRPGGSDDVSWERIAVVRNDKPYPSLMHAFPKTQFVGYTKNPRRFDRALPPNYHLTFSRSETNEADCLRLLARGVNVAVVFGNALPETYLGRPVIDGDQHDLRHLDPIGGNIIGLRPKGAKAKADRSSGFVVWL
jgi:hypothetical protein